MNISLNLGKNTLESPSLTAVFFHLGGLLTRASCEGAAPLQPALSPAPLPCASRAAPGRRFAEKPGVPKRNPEQMAAVAVQPQKGTFKSK